MGLDIEKFLRIVSELLPWLEGLQVFVVIRGVLYSMLCVNSVYKCCQYLIATLTTFYK